MRAQNNSQASQDSLGVLQKLLSNVNDNPGQEKFLGIKKTNPALQRRLLGCTGIMDVLRLAGYADVSEEMMTLSQTGQAQIQTTIEVVTTHVNQLTEENKTPEQRAAEKRDAEIKAKMEAKAAQKKRILDQAELDRKEQAKKLRPTEDSKAVKRAFGSGTQANFRDIGVDLNKKGG